MSDTATITVTVNDVNEAPTVQAAQVFSVAEDAVDTTVVGTVLATDPEDNITAFAITLGNGDAIFGIDNSGVITVVDNTNLDFETTEQYILTIEATDAGALPGSETVTINVTDVAE